MTWTSILKRSEIHADVIWAYNQAQKKDSTKFPIADLREAHRALDDAAEKDAEERDESEAKVTNILSRGFFSNSRDRLTPVEFEKDKRKFVNRINSLERLLNKRSKESMKLPEGQTLNIRDLDALREENSLLELLFEGEKKVLVKLKTALGERKDAAIDFAEKLYDAMKSWDTYGDNTRSRNLVDDLRPRLASGAKNLQAYLLEGKGRIRTEVSSLFHEKNAEFDEESKTWSPLVVYPKGNTSLELLEKIYSYLRIPIKISGEDEAGEKAIRSYFSLDVDEFVDEIHDMIGSDDPKIHAKLFFNKDDVLRKIYRIVPEIIQIAEEKMDDKEKGELLTKHFDVLEYLIRINSLTGDYSRLKENRLDKVKRFAHMRKGKRNLSMNRNFPMLEDAYEEYEANPSEYHTSGRKKQRTPPKLQSKRLVLRNPSLPSQYQGPRTKEEVERDVSNFTTFSRKIYQEIKPKLTSGELERKTLVGMKRTLDSFKEKMEKHDLLLEDTIDVMGIQGIENEDDLDEAINKYKEMLQRIKSERTDDGKIIGEDGEEYDADELIESYEDYLEYLNVLSAIPRLKEVIPRLETILQNVKLEEQSLDEPSSDDAEEESA